MLNTAEGADPGRSASSITIVQPSVPLYRVPLFDVLYTLFKRDGFELIVAHPEPQADQAARGDAARGPWSRPLRSRALRLGPRTFHYRDTAKLAKTSAVMVAELASTNLDVYRLAATRKTPLVLWGHGRAYVTARNPIDERLELWLARRAAHLLVYTTTGRDYLVDRGIELSKITVVQNTTDTESLRREMLAITSQQIAAFRAQHRIRSDNVAMFVGALGVPKRIQLLLEASALVRLTVPDFQLVIAGQGPLQPWVSQAARIQPELRLLPYADVHTLALIGAVSALCMMPGRVGLVAVDAMTLGLPVVTTDWPYHAPEREYLEPDFCVTARQTSDDVAAKTIEMLADPARRRAASVAAKLAARPLSIENMAHRMHDAILACAVRPS